MIGPHRVEGYAIVSADGMIADGRRRDAGFDPQRRRSEISADGTGSSRRGRARTPLARRRPARGEAQTHRRYPPDRERGARSVAPERRAVEPGRAPRSNRPSRRSASAKERSPSSAAPRCSDCSCRFTTPSTSPTPLAPRFPVAGRFSAGRPKRDARRCARRHGLRAGPPRDIDAAAGITLVTWERPRQ